MRQSAWGFIPCPKSHRCYFVWEYGKALDVVIEVVSNRDGGEDSAKLAVCARVGVRSEALNKPSRAVPVPALASGLDLA